VRKRSRVGGTVDEHLQALKFGTELMRKDDSILKIEFRHPKRGKGGEGANDWMEIVQQRR
jgi:hypothetical protein